MRKTVYTSESVCAGHPDKICDQISDAIVDHALSLDNYSRVAVETLVTKNFVCLAGEVTSEGKVPYASIAHNVIKRLGYLDNALHFTYRSPIIVKIHTQSNDIAVGVDKLGAGDQGMMYGYATKETKNYMPTPIAIAHRLAMDLDAARESRVIPYLRPDGKTQVTVDYIHDIPYAVSQVVLAVPHSPSVSLNELKYGIYKRIVIPVLAEFGFSMPIENLVVNGTGVWHYSGPAADTGVTGRKIIVDTYGGLAKVGGGAFSGKDPTKVDRSGAYAARYIAKNIVAAGLADRCEVRLAYYIGAKKPLMQEIETFDTAKKKEKVLKDYMNKLLDTSVAGIIEALNLRRPIYSKTAAYGHFGREEFPWEKIVSV